MLSPILLLFALATGAGATAEYNRTLSLTALDQAAFDAETYGEKKGLKREADGLRMTLAPGEAETGWKTPQQIRFGGDFTISATVVIKTLPKPAQEDGAAIGLAIAFQDINQPDATLLRIREPKGAEVYRFIEKSQINPQQQQQMQMQMQMQMQQGFGGAVKPPKPPRLTVPAGGDQIRLQIQREGQVVRFEVVGRRNRRRSLPRPGTASAAGRCVGQVVRHQPQRGRADQCSLARFHGPGRSDQWAGHHRQNRPRRSCLRRPHLDRKQPPGPGRPAQGAPPAGAETRRCEARCSRRD